MDVTRVAMATPPKEPVTLLSLFSCVQNDTGSSFQYCASMLLCLPTSALKGRGGGSSDSPESEVNLARSGGRADLPAEVFIINLESHWQPWRQETMRKARGPVRYADTVFKLSAAHLPPKFGWKQGLREAGSETHMATGKKAGSTHSSAT